MIFFFFSDRFNNSGRLPTNTQFNRLLKSTLDKYLYRGSYYFVFRKR